MGAQCPQRQLQLHASREGLVLDLLDAQRGGLQEGCGAHPWMLQHRLRRGLCVVVQRRARSVQRAPEQG